MKTKLFTFFINSDQKIKIVRKIKPSVSISEEKEINIVIDDLETEISNLISDYLNKKGLENSSIKVDYNNFLKELKSYKFNH